MEQHKCWFISVHKQAAKERDKIGRFPLHTFYSSKTFYQAPTEVIKALLAAFPEVAKEKGQRWLTQADIADFTTREVARLRLMLRRACFRDSKMSLCFVVVTSKPVGAGIAFRTLAEAK